ncbi:hypothetical protein L1987_45029 [Smallanthus sonchifolius]|uniref:Uncharacterized protein n=1 Tax=Smallanthus sonchifolius TaxID=185202 RepID=A0ACB9GQU9_9ASTR|nr:hypothetical protein L1987_45029 [Smallanthus sonchifolius]
MEMQEVVVDTLMECLKDGNAGKFHSFAYHKFIHNLALLICLICGILCMMRVMIFMFDHKKAKWDAEVTDFSRVFRLPKVYSLYYSQFAAYEPPVIEGLDLLLMETMVFGFA